MTDKDFIAKLKTINIGVKPPWTEPLKDLKRTINNPEANTKIAEESERLRKQWTTDGKWASWEKGRKDYIKSQKQEWIKRGAKPSERDEIMKG